MRTHDQRVWRSPGSSSCLLQFFWTARILKLSLKSLSQRKTDDNRCVRRSAHVSTPIGLMSVCNVSVDLADGASRGSSITSTRDTAAFIAHRCDIFLRAVRPPRSDTFRTQPSSPPCATLSPPLCPRDGDFPMVPAVIILPCD